MVEVNWSDDDRELAASISWDINKIKTELTSDRLAKLSFLFNL